MFDKQFYDREVFKTNSLPTEWVQENISYSKKKGTLRGLHYQWAPAQGKLVGVIRGRIWDVVVDIRWGSPTFGRSLGIELSDDRGALLWVPAGFAHEEAQAIAGGGPRE